MPKSKRVTLKQVAEHASVSPMTVSNFVNGRLELLSPKMRERVERSVKALNYRRNYGAHLLRTSKLWSIGMLVVDESDHYLSDGYTTEIISGVSNKLDSHGFSTLLQGVKPSEFRNSSLLRNLHTDGLCVLLSGSDSDRAGQFEEILNLGQPTILFLEEYRHSPETVCSIVQNDYTGARDLARHVLKRSPRHVLILTTGVNEWAAVNRRVEGMKDALGESGTVERLSVVSCGDCRIDDVGEAFAGYVSGSGYPDAVMCINDQIGLAVVKSLRTAGISVPDRTCVTGFNAFGLHRLAETTLTTMRSPAYEMGSVGATELLRALETGRFANQSIAFSVEVVQGQSA